MKYDWISFDGKWNVQSEEIVFEGGEQELEAPSSTDASGNSASNPETSGQKIIVPAIGNIVSNAKFSEGKISVDVTFDEFVEHQSAEIIVQLNPANRVALHVGIGGPTDALYSIRVWGPQLSNDLASGEHSTDSNLERPYRFTYLRWTGNPSDLKCLSSYRLQVQVKNTELRFLVNGVVVFQHEMKNVLDGYQVGLFARSKSKVRFKNFSVDFVKPQAFVVMQFNTPEYEDLFNEVIKPQCELAGFDAYRATDTYMPGIVISDIAKQISQSRVIIAEISPVNANVYYEVGYADALKKPIILIADRAIKDIPFDVRPYRIIFYENSIGGKKRVEGDLAKYLASILPPG